MIKKPTKVKVTLYLTIDQVKGLKELAGQSDVSYASLIRLAINKFVGEKLDAN
jgi:hypothetical protein